MSSSSDDEERGYGRPPKRTRWKKGQSGNPNRRYRARDRSTIAMMERSFLKPVEITLNGMRKKVPTLEAIVRLISQKVLSGDRSALPALTKYKEFAAQFQERKVRLIFVDNDYTQAVAATPLTGEDGQ